VPLMCCSVSVDLYCMAAYAKGRCRGGSVLLAFLQCMSCSWSRLRPPPQVTDDEHPAGPQQCIVAMFVTILSSQGVASAGVWDVNSQATDGLFGRCTSLLLCTLCAYLG
jgi:hypothetical protein